MTIKNKLKLALIGCGRISDNHLKAVLDNYLGRTEERLIHFQGITVKRGGRIGAGAVILPGKVIGEDALVAAGSVVTKDVPARIVVMGSPARVVRDVPEEQLIENQKFYIGKGNDEDTRKS